MLSEDLKRRFLSWLLENGEDLMGKSISYEELMSELECTEEELMQLVVLVNGVKH